MAEDVGNLCVSADAPGTSQWRVTGTDSEEGREETANINSSCTGTGVPQEGRLLSGRLNTAENLNQAKVTAPSFMPSTLRTLYTPWACLLCLPMCCRNQLLLLSVL